MDYCPSEPDFAKVPLYNPDCTFMNNNKNHSHLTGNDEQTSLNNTSSPSTNIPSWTPPSYDLQEMLIHYRSQPDLLQLILESKLQEDRRRTEEARLKAKELDLLLLQHQHQLHHQHHASFTTPSLLLSSSSPAASSLSSASSILSSASPSSNSAASPSSDHVAPQQHSSTAAIGIPLSSPSPSSFLTRRRDSSSLFSSTTSEELDEAIFLQQMANSIPDNSIDTHPLHPQQQQQHDSLTSPCTIPDFYNLHQQNKDTINLAAQRTSPPPPQRPRKRREMQAITKLVETREYPYLDGHFWRNNGNTIQKKTGNKSVYFKCSNSTKGCPVNKTSTYCEETGEYIIKYRGHHLPECGKVQHIVEV